MKIEAVCKNVFKNNDKKKLKEEFTKKWIEIINNQEKSGNYTQKKVHHL